MSKLTLQYEKIKPTTAPYTDNPSLHNCFVICLKNNTDSMPYYTVRAQKKNLPRALKHLSSNCPVPFDAGGT